MNIFFSWHSATLSVPVLAENERSMPDLTYPTSEAFLRRMDAGDFDGNLHVEIKKLSKEQLSALGVILLRRSATPRAKPCPRLPGPLSAGTLI